MGIDKVNIEVVASVGPMVSQAVCGGVLQFSTIPEPSASGAGGITIMGGMGGVVLSIPRARYAEVRDLHPLDRVRVRGYVSKWFSQGCDWFSRTSTRYLWIDSIELLPREGGDTPAVNAPVIHSVR
jgi:hypothetical protein